MAFDGHGTSTYFVEGGRGSPSTNLPSSLADLKIGTRLACAFILMVVMALVIGGFGMAQTARVNAGAEELGENWLPSVKLLGDIRQNMNAARRMVLGHVLEESDEAKRRRQALFEALMSGPVAKSTAAYRRFVDTPEDEQLFNDCMAKLVLATEVNRQVLALSSRGPEGLSEARALAAGDSEKAFLAFDAALEKNIEVNQRGAVQEVALARATYRSALLRAGILAAVAASAGLIFAWAITRSIVRPILSALGLARRVADSDLTANVVPSGSDEAAQLLVALNAMRGSLASIVGEVRASSERIAIGTAQIATGNADLSQRTEEQASNLQQTAASMEELSGTVRANAEIASRANALAEATSRKATAGGLIVDRVVAAMADIAESAKRISSIIALIDGIAFKTRLLALNASVEAARAGTQGRGFAVVAGEVRTLAGHAADAAREIKLLIASSVDKIEIGTQEVNEAGRSMSAIVAEVANVGQLLGQITNASAEQAVGISQVGEAISQLDQVTQQNAALVEESAAAAESLKGQAAQLAALMRVFRIPMPEAITPTPMAAR